MTLFLAADLQLDGARFELLDENSLFASPRECRSNRDRKGDHLTNKGYLRAINQKKKKENFNMSYSKIALFVLVGALFSSAVLAQLDEESAVNATQDAANKTGRVVQNARKAVRGAAHNLVDQAGQTIDKSSNVIQGLAGQAHGAAQGLVGLGRGVYDTIKSTGSSILSHIKNIGHNESVDEGPSDESAEHGTKMNANHKAVEEDGASGTADNSAHDQRAGQSEDSSVADESAASKSKKNSKQ